MVDFALVALIALIAAYAGGVTTIVRLRPAGPARALLEGVGVAAGVTASFALMLVLARVWLRARSSSPHCWPGASSTARCCAI
jgi:hypothetical protein